MLLLVPNDPLTPRRADEHFAPEAEAAGRLGVEVGLIDHDALCAGDADAAVRRVTARGEAVYRGWMVRPGEYVALGEALALRGVSLRTPPDHYAAAHLLPRWYPHFVEVTPRTVVLPGPDLDGLDDARRAIGSGAAVVKDHVKSMKHYWDEAMFIPDITDGAVAHRVAQRFLDLRGDDLVGGLVVRAYESLAGPEARTWWVHGACVLVTPHPDSPDAAPPAVPTDAFAGAVQALGSPFVAVDLARREDGVWRVIEVGDGQVSDRPATADPEAFLTAVFD